MRLLVVDCQYAEEWDLVARPRTDGHHVAVAEAVQDLPARVLGERIHLVLLDATLLPGQCLVELCRTLRRESSVLLLLLGQADAPSEHIPALEAGGDVWLARPVADDEILAQIHALLRRHPLSAVVAGPPRMRVTTDLVVDLASQKLVGPGRVSALTDREFRLLIYLVRNEGAVLSREALLNAVWGDDDAISDREVDVYVRYLRRKIETDPAHPRYLLTAWGRGYQYRGPRAVPSPCGLASGRSVKPARNCCKRARGPRRDGEQAHRGPRIDGRST